MPDQAPYRPTAVPTTAPTSGISQAEQIDQRLTELEIKVTFTEDLLEQLNQTIFRQQQQIDLLLREVAHLRQQRADEQPGLARYLRDELPPHY